MTEEIFKEEKIIKVRKEENEKVRKEENEKVRKENEQLRKDNVVKDANIKESVEKQKETKIPKEN